MIRQRPLVVGAAALFGAGLANRVLGTAYRIVLARVAGDEILGLFQLTRPVYFMIYELATFGFPVAIAKLSAEALGRGDRELARNLRFTGILLIILAASLTGTGFFLTAGFWASAVLTTPQTELTLKVLALLLIPTALSAGFRGVLQGQERLVPVALSSLVEAVSRVPLVLYLVSVLLPHGPALASAGIAAGSIVPEILSILVLVLATPMPSRSEVSRRRPVRHRVHSRAWRRRYFRLSCSLLRIASPVAGSGLLNGAVNLVAVSLIPRQLAQAGLDPSAIAAAYGQLSGMAMPLLYMPLVAIGPIAQVLMPAISNRLARGGSKTASSLLRRAFIPTLAIALTTSTVFFLFPETLGRLLYGVSGLGSLIQPLAIAAPFAYLGLIATSTLYGIGRTGTVMMNALCGNLLRAGLIYVLVPVWGIHGALWSILADHILTGLLHLLALVKVQR